MGFIFGEFLSRSIHVANKAAKSFEITHTLEPYSLKEHQNTYYSLSFPNLKSIYVFPYKRYLGATTMSTNRPVRANHLHVCSKCLKSILKLYLFDNRGGKHPVYTTQERISTLQVKSSRHWRYVNYELNLDAEKNLCKSRQDVTRYAYTRCNISLCHSLRIQEMAHLSPPF